MHFGPKLHIAHRLNLAERFKLVNLYTSFQNRPAFIIDEQPRQYFSQQSTMLEHLENGVALATLALLIWWLSQKMVPKANDTTNSLPGPTLLDYLIPGSLLHKLMLDPQAATRTVFQLHSKYGDVFQMPLGFFKSVATANPDDMAYIVSNSNFQKSPGDYYTLHEGAPGNLFILEGEEHKKLRKHFQETFNSSLLPDFHRFMADAVVEGANVLQKLSELVKVSPEGMNDEDKSIYNAFVINGYIDTARVISVITLKAITSVCFGVALTVEQRQAFSNDVEVLFDEMLKDVMLHPFRKYVGLIPIIGPRVARRRYNDIMQRIRKHCIDFTKDRVRDWNDPTIENPAESKNLTDAILKANSTDVQFIITHTITFALAGSLSTNQTLVWALYELCKPESSSAYRLAQKEVDEATQGFSSNECLSYESVAEMQYIRAVWKETLRLHPVGHGLFRQALKDVTLPGSKIRVPAGMSVQALAHIAQVDERYYSNASKFDPDRWLSLKSNDTLRRRPLSAYMPFGLGSHNCAGQFFAEHEGVFALAEILRRFELRLPCKAEDVVSCSGFVEIAKFSSLNNGVLDIGVPIEATSRLSSLGKY